MSYPTEFYTHARHNAKHALLRIQAFASPVIWVTILSTGNAWHVPILMLSSATGERITPWFAGLEWSHQMEPARLVLPTAYLALSMGRVNVTLTSVLRVTLPSMVLAIALNVLAVRLATEPTLRFASVVRTVSTWTAPANASLVRLNV
jgi:hypothetical protein